MKVRIFDIHIFIFLINNLHILPNGISLFKFNDTDTGHESNLFIVNNRGIRTTSLTLVLSLLLSLNRFQILFWCFHCFQCLQCRLANQCLLCQCLKPSNTSNVSTFHWIFQLLNLSELQIVVYGCSYL